jgi:hypothetical protein
MYLQKELIGESPLRDRSIQEEIGSIYNMALCATKAESYDVAREKFEKLAQRFGLEILERRITDCSFQCAEYIFREIKGEPWGRTEPGNLQFWKSFDFLESNGYKRVTEPVDGDVVAYKRFPEGEVEHWGVWVYGKVQSKWGVGYIYIHEPELVPFIYGEPFAYFRKKIRLILHINA